MKMYMNVETGSVDNYDGWWYTDENGSRLNAVEDGDVVEVRRSKIDDQWVEA